MLNFQVLSIRGKTAPNGLLVSIATKSATPVRPNKVETCDIALVALNS